MCTYVAFVCVYILLPFWGYSPTVSCWPEVWAVNWGAYWLWAVAMPEAKVPELLTHIS